MNILVCVKRVPLTGGKMVLTADERAIETRHLGFTISPHEECAVEEALHSAVSVSARSRQRRDRGREARHLARGSGAGSLRRCALAGKS